jgi:hypothetical protein
MKSNNVGMLELPPLALPLASEGEEKKLIYPLIPTFSRWRRSLEPKVNSLGLRLSIFISN